MDLQKELNTYRKSLKYFGFTAIKGRPNHFENTKFEMYAQIDTKPYSAVWIVGGDIPDTGYMAPGKTFYDVKELNETLLKYTTNPPEGIK